MARHFLYTTIHHEENISIQLVNRICQMNNDQVYEFLMTLLAHMHIMFNNLECQLFDYKKFKHLNCDSLKNTFSDDLRLDEQN